MGVPPGCVKVLRLESRNCSTAWKIGMHAYSTLRNQLARSAWPRKHPSAGNGTHSRTPAGDTHLTIWQALPASCNVGTSGATKNRDR
ncbi:MAG: hypothetical protein GXP41_05270 [Chloroflexi bacterium]|nr:hypothetical protein [Chloroflexota bacterium]